MKKILLIISVVFISLRFVYSQTQEYNYIKSTTFLEADQSKKVTSISYKDGFGRPLQNIVIDASPAGNDIVQTYQYDELGRSKKKYMPFTNSGNQNGEFVNDALSLQTAFYNAQFQNQNAYSEVEYDNSPYNRIVKQSSPGEDINSINVSSEFEAFGGLNIWKVNDNNQLIISGTYPENSLMKFTAKNKDNKKIYIYKDKSGKVLLKEQFLGNLSVKTRYAYDKFGQLRYVVPPKAVNNMTGANFTKNSTIIKQYCYYYEYNDKHQLITKQLPGKEAIYIRYDTKYRLRMTQDGNQRLLNKWMFINYDKLGRTISTGLGYTDESMPDTISPPETKGISAFLTYQYYDNYDFIKNSNLNYDINFAYNNEDYFKRIKGKSTGSKVKVMDGTEKWLTSVVYYDKKGRAIQTISQNNVGGYDKVANEYDFSGKLLKSKNKHTSSSQTKYLVYLYQYDEMGRLLKTELSQNEKETNKVIINEIKYNELGQIKEKNIHKEAGATDYLQTVDYKYNIKGAITQINDPTSINENSDTKKLFGMNLLYNTYKDGKISGIEWNSKNLNLINSYRYQYDDLNRLTNAIYSPNSKYDVNIEYDLNGNITHLIRKGQVLRKSISSIKKSGNKGFQPPFTEENDFRNIDDLEYTYSGNQLERVDDAIGETNSQLNNDFKDYKNNEILETEYYYDANGNMISDKNKSITNIKYNHLNQATEVDFGIKKTKYIYTATGVKLQTQIFEGTQLKTKTDYSGAYVYVNNVLSYTNILGGRIVSSQTEGTNNNDVFQYNLTDHLGNVRVTFEKGADGKAEIIQEDHYYPFGMRMSGQHYDNKSLINKYLYNGKEQQEQTNYYDYGFRQLDPQLGRWHVVDALAENYFSESPYSYAGNNPINYIDILGLGYTYNWDTGNYENGNGDVVDWSEVYDWIQGSISNGSIDGALSINFQNGSFNNGGNGSFTGTLSGGQKFSFFGFDNMIDMVGLALSGLTCTIATVDGVSAVYSSIGKLGTFTEGKNGAYTNSNNTAAQFLGDISSGGGDTGGGLNTVGNIASGVGVTGTGLGMIDGTFRLAKSGKFSLGYYSSGWSSGNQYVKNLYSVSKVGNGISSVANIVTTGIAINHIYSGRAQPITYADAGVGVMGVIVSGASYFYGVQIPVVGEFVAVYGASRVTWDVFYYLGSQYGPSTWYGTNDYSWFK